MKPEKYLKTLLLVLIVPLMLWAAVMILFDPYFHYHGPVPGLSYRLYEERYVNDGIGRHFDYDAMITGTSMSQNFKTTEFDALFGVHSVKLPFAGAGFKELKANLERCLARNPECKTVLMPIDFAGLIRAWDWDQYGDQPDYLYDDDPFNDSSYLWNKDILYRGLLFNLTRTFRGEPTTSFDEYSAWEADTGLDAILRSGYARREEIKPMQHALTEEDEGLLRGTIENIFIPLTTEHPGVHFIFFYTPYSIVAFDDWYREGRLEEIFIAEERVTKELLSHENVSLYCFYDHHEIMEDLELYRDKEHYSAEVNSMILQWIKAGEGELTAGNYQEHIRRCRDYYLHYDYDAIYR